MIKSLSARVLLALVAGLAAGAAVQASGSEALTGVIEGVEAVGGLWLNLLRMTVVPLVFSLLVVGIASVADAASTGRLAGRAVMIFSVILLAAAVYSMFATQGLLAVWPVAPEGAQALLAGARSSAAAIPEAPGFGEWIRTLAPTNPIQAAAEDAILPLVVFAVFFAFAATRLPTEMRAGLVGLFRAVSQTMIVIVRWVLWAAPLGVFALALGVGLRAGVSAAGTLLQYVTAVSLVTAFATLLMYLLPLLARVPIGRFARAAAPVQAVAFSTQSSLACLPLMVERSQDDLGIPPRITGLILPLAVAVFRMTSPIANLAVAFFIAHLYGLQPGPLQMLGAVFVAFAVSVGSVGLPGQVSFFASMAPICLALGLPLDLLPILLAVEVIPDIFRTLGNVTADMAVTAVLGRDEIDEAPADTDNLADVPPDAGATETI